MVAYILPIIWNGSSGFLLLVVSHAGNFMFLDDRDYDVMNMIMTVIRAGGMLDVTLARSNN